MKGNETRIEIILLLYAFMKEKKKKRKKGTYASMLRQKKPNFPERFQADNGKNWNIPERNLSKQTIK